MLLTNLSPTLYILYILSIKQSSHITKTKIYHVLLNAAYYVSLTILIQYSNELLQV